MLLALNTNALANTLLTFYLQLIEPVIDSLLGGFVQHPSIINEVVQGGSGGVDHIKLASNSYS